MFMHLSLTNSTRNYNETKIFIVLDFNLVYGIYINLKCGKKENKDEKVNKITVALFVHVYI